MPAGPRAARPLAGRVVLVTRAREQAGALRSRLERLGADVIEAPAIQLAAPPDWGPLDAALARLDAYDWIVFTSQNTLPRLLARLDARGLGPDALQGSRIAAIGSATARGLAAAGLRVEVMPEEFRGEAVAAALLAREPFAGQRILLPRALVAREALPAALRAAGATVDVVPVYQALPAREAADRARAALLEGSLDAVTFTSTSTVDGFLDAVGDAPGVRAALADICRASIGPITSARLASRGQPPTVEATVYTIAGLVDALAAHFAGPAGRPGR